MRIAYVCLDRGIPVRGGKGASVHVRSITTALARRGHHVALVCATLGQGNASPAVARIDEVGPDLSGLEYRLESIFGDEAVDVVLERYSLASGPTSAVCSRLGIPLVLEVNAPIVHEAARYRGLLHVDEALAREREVFESAQAIAAVSGALVDYATRVAPLTPAVWIANGVDVDRFATAEPVRLARHPAEVVIGFVGSMKAWHGVDDLLTAFAVVASRHPEVRLVVAGSGPEEGALRSQVATGDLGDRVTMLGLLPHDRVAGVVRGFDIGVAPYRPSTDFYFCPLKVLEYLGAGVPPVFPDLGDLPQLVGDAGVGYQPGSVDALTAALERLVVDPELRRSKAARARARRPDYDWTCTARRTEELLMARVVAPALEER